MQEGEDLGMERARQIGKKRGQMEEQQDGNAEDPGYGRKRETATRNWGRGERRWLRSVNQRGVHTLAGRRVAGITNDAKKKAASQRREQGGRDRAARPRVNKDSGGEPRTRHGNPRIAGEQPRDSGQGKCDGGRTDGE